MLRFWIAGIVILIGLSYTLQFKDSNSIPRKPASFNLFKTSTLDTKEILAASSSSPLTIKKARVIIDNDASFDSKIEAIQSAKPGETIRLSYYIYSQDESSSIFLNELLKAAARGVHVRLMADLITNYDNMDLFTYLEEKSRGMIQVKYYGRPSPLIVRDIMFMTYPCPPSDDRVKANTCSDEKWKQLKGSSPDFFARLMLSGLYDLNFSAVTTAVLKGQVLDLESLTKDSRTSTEDKKQFLEFLKLLYKSKVKNDPIAGIKVLLALQFYGDKLNPVLNEILGRVPINQKNEKSLADWEHITDFTHHKVLIVENRFIQLGGRNIENSYHMKPNALTKKYIFMDTDMSMEVTSGGETVSKSFDRLWNFSVLTIPLKEARKVLSNELVVNKEAMKAAFDKCIANPYKTPTDRVRFEKCVEFELPRHSKYEALNTRLEKIEKKIADGIHAYNTQYLPKKSYTQTWKSGSAYSDELTEKDAKEALFTYIENLPFDGRKDDKELMRSYGSIAGQEAKSGKNIHQLWYKGLQNTCAVAAKEGLEKRVIIYSAYLLPPAILLRGFSKMMDGTWDCGKVRVTFISNSPETTDLNHINVVARYVMSTLMQTYQNRRQIFGSGSDNRAAKFEYFEYRKETAGSGLSLHSKVSVLGNDMIIGSANADVRSYYMDSNNGFFIRGANDLTTSYIEYIDSIIKNPKKTQDLTAQYSDSKMTVDAIYAEDLKMIDHMLSKTEFSKKLSANNRQKLNNMLRAIVGFVSDSTAKILIKDRNRVVGPNYDNTDTQKQDQAQKEQEQKYDRLLQLL